VTITYAGLAFLYKVLPNARVRLRSALIAAFAAGTAWELAKFIFADLSARMVQVHKIYGSVAVLPIVLTWLYISWFITLTGCRLCYAMDASRTPQASPPQVVSGVLKVPAIMFQFKDIAFPPSLTHDAYDAVLFAATPPPGRPYTYRT